MSHLFNPLRLGALDLPNRIVMAPLTRARADAETRVPVPMMAEYYAQRAGAGLILSEATIVDPQGAGYVATPGIYSDEQTEGWKQVTEAVHKAGGRIFMQLWHVGRISDPSLLGGETPVSASAVQAKGHVSLLRPERPYPVPRPLETAEVKGVVAAFRKGAENAKKAGFDGVELHAANGYLIDQFLQDSTNQRSDEYGGSREKRARLLLEIADSVSEVWGADRVGVHLAPRSDAHDMGDSDRLATFTYAASELGKRKLAFICTREALKPDSIAPRMKDAFGGVFIANEGFDQGSAEQALADGIADAVAFGKLFIANPDLVTRFKTGAELNRWDMATFYAPGPKGYTDYPALEG